MKPSAKPAQKNLADVFQQSPITAWLSVCLFAAVLVCVPISYYLWATLVVSEREHQLAEFTEQHLKKATSNVAAHMLSLNKKVAFFGQSSQLSNALEKEDALELRRVRLSIMNNFAQAEGVRLIPKGKAKLNLDAALPLRFSELEMIQAIEARANVQPEAVKLSQGWRLNFAVPIPTDPSKPVAGTLLITTSLESTFAAMTEGLENFGSFTLLQNYSGGQHRLHSQGSGGFLPTQTRAIPGTPWAVEYSPSANLLKQVQTNGLIFAIGTGITWLLGLTVAAAIGLFVGKRGERQRQAIEKTYDVEFSLLISNNYPADPPRVLCNTIFTFPSTSDGRDLLPLIIRRRWVPQFTLLDVIKKLSTLVFEIESVFVHKVNLFSVGDLKLGSEFQLDFGPTKRTCKPSHAKR